MKIWHSRGHKLAEAKSSKGQTEWICDRCGYRILIALINPSDLYGGALVTEFFGSQATQQTAMGKWWRWVKPAITCDELLKPCLYLNSIECKL